MAKSNVISLAECKAPAVQAQFAEHGEAACAAVVEQENLSPEYWAFWLEAVRECKAEFFDSLFEVHKLQHGFVLLFSDKKDKEGFSGIEQSDYFDEMAKAKLDLYERNRLDFPAEFRPMLHVVPSSNI